MSLEIFFQQLHLLRPWALLIIPAAVLVFYSIHRRRNKQNSWAQIIEPELLSKLSFDPSEKGHSQHWLMPAIIASLLLGLAAAGPSWQKLTQPVHKRQDALVIVLDLSPSMLAEDIKPSRLVRARYKLIDLLKLRREGQTALIAYGGEAHTVSPLTDDTETIINLLPALSPGLIPLSGSNTEMAIETAIKLLKAAGHQQGNILLVSDGVVDEAQATIDDLLSASTYQLSVMAVGTPAGGPIPTRSGFAKTNDGAIVVASLKADVLIQLAKDNHGLFVNMSSSDTDLKILSEFWSQGFKADALQQQERDSEQWQDEGFWLLLPLLLLFLLNFRKGLIISSFPVFLSLLAAQTLTSNKAQAQTKTAPPQNQAEQAGPPASSFSESTLWDKLWSNQQQRAHQAFDKQDYQQAENLFENSQWKGVSKAKQGNLQGAIEDLSQDTTAEGLYNTGNAQAMDGQLDAAIKSFNKSLELDPGNADAQSNIDLLEKLKQQQDEDKQQQPSDKQEQGEEQGDQQQKDQDGDKQSGDGKQGDNSEQNKPQNSESESESKDGEDGESQPQQQDENKQQGDSSKQEQAGEDQKPSEQNADEQASADQPQNVGGEQLNEEEKQQRQALAQQLADQEADLSPEQKQALEQWLQQVPDDPSGLMRRKFQYQYDQRRKAYRKGQWQPPKNQADKRW